MQESMFLLVHGLTTLGLRQSHDLASARVFARAKSSCFFIDSLLEKTTLSTFKGHLLFAGMSLLVLYIFELSAYVFSLLVKVTYVKHLI